MATKRGWTIIAEGSIVRRIIGTPDRRKGHEGEYIIQPEVPGLSARVLSNAACFIYPSEPEEYDVEVLKADPETGKYKWAKSKRVRWVKAGAERDFMPSVTPATVPERDRYLVADWPEVFRRAGDALISFLSDHRRP